MTCVLYVLGCLLLLLCNQRFMKALNVILLLLVLSSFLCLAFYDSKSKVDKGSFIQSTREAKCFSQNAYLYHQSDFWGIG